MLRNYKKGGNETIQNAFVKYGTNLLYFLKEFTVETIPGVPKRNKIHDIFEK